MLTAFVILSEAKDLCMFLQRAESIDPSLRSGRQRGAGSAESYRDCFSADRFRCEM